MSDKEQQAAERCRPGRARLEDLPDVMSIEQAALFLGLGRNTVYEAVRRKELHTLRIGRRLLVPRAGLERLLAGSGDEQPADSPRRIR